MAGRGGVKHDINELPNVVGKPSLSASIVESLQLNQLSWELQHLLCQYHDFFQLQLNFSSGRLSTVRKAR
jgi:hypothetical protein